MYTLLKTLKLTRQKNNSMAGLNGPNGLIFTPEGKSKLLAKYFVQDWP